MSVAPVLIIVDGPPRVGLMDGSTRDEPRCTGGRSASVISAGVLAARGIGLDGIVGCRVIDHPALQI